ncbi:MAG: tautomerase family protein [Acetobacteraceae bacterium]|nr:tautomerase family protein [Acetobacteraceae bacterium]
MPHVIVKLYPGRSEEQKAAIAEAVTQAVMATANCTEAAVSVGIEEVAKPDWTARVYHPDITEKQATIYKQPGYPPA